MTNKMLIPLTPVRIKSDDAAYKSVEELSEVLEKAKEYGIKNVALTGPYGSGKSSILKTLREDFLNKSENLHSLFISLATLQTNDESETESNDSESSDTELNEEEEDKLNRRIEYSILQQLVYKEKIEDVPNSRISRILHYDKKSITCFALKSVATLIAYLVLFEPNWAHIDTLYNFLNFGKFNIIADIMSAIWLVYSFFSLAAYFVKSYGNSKLNLLNLKDGEIKLDDQNEISTSIFNRYLDEILYFFQVTPYNVVVIEDLDRFNTHRIFLKLRELNQILNESKIVGRHITFVYAIKDDMFKNEERTKFFDYITTVIPVINPSNSKTKLKEALTNLGFDENEIADEDLSEMGYFIQDMRILTNIANEYKQYRDRLCAQTENHLNYTKLLAMIVYKNYYPKDFSKLHRRQGVVYDCISKRRQFEENAVKEIDSQFKELDEQEKFYHQSLVFTEKDLRTLFLNQMVLNLNYPLSFTHFMISGNRYTLVEVVENNELFYQLLNSGQITYRYSDWSNNDSQAVENVNIEDVDKNVRYSERMDILRNGLKTINEQRDFLLRKKNKLKSLHFKDLINDCFLENSELYKSLNLSPLQDVFIRTGYIEEDYYDYISYFYEGMITLSDRDLLLAMKRYKPTPYDMRIDKIENFVKELSVRLFQNDSILNNQLLDFLASNKEYEDKFRQMMMRIERENAPLAFLVQYVQHGKKVKVVFKHLLEWNRESIWNQFQSHADSVEKSILTTSFLKYCDKLSDAEQEWMDKNYIFLVDHVRELGHQRCKALIEYSCFSNLSTNNPSLLTTVIENCSYNISNENLLLIVKFLSEDSVSITQENLNLAHIFATNNPKTINYVKDNVAMVIEELKDVEKSESSEAILFVLNSKDIDASTKECYLKDQQNRIPDLTGVEDSAMFDLIFRHLLVQPTWRSVLKYYEFKQRASDELYAYLSHYYSVLSLEQCTGDADLISRLFTDLFCSNYFQLDVYDNLLDAFPDYEIEADNDVSLLSKEQLNTLIDKGKIPFSEEYLPMINNAKSLTKYLLYYPKEFLSNLNWSYDIDYQTFMELLKSATFNDEDKRKILAIVDVNLLTQDADTANLVLSVIVNSNDLDLSNDVLPLNLLRSSSDAKLRLQFAARMISRHNELEIDTYLMALGDTYSIISEKDKRPKIPENEYNRELLEVLKRVGYISSYSPVKSKDNLPLLRVNHSTK